MPGREGPSRRAVLISGLSGVVGLLAACTSSSADTSGTSGPISARLTPDPSATGTSVPSANATLGATHVSAGDQVSTADAERYRTAVEGTWRGAWRDTSGAHGTSDFTVALDVRTRSVRATVAADGPIVAGGSLPSAEYTIDLLGFARTAPTWTVDSPQLGSVRFEASGGTSLSGTATGVPGHPEISRIEFTGTRTARRVDGAYTITKTDGSTVKGAMAWSAVGARAVPNDPSDTAHDTPADIQSGAYAASLATADSLSQAMGTPVGDPIDNGGRIEAYPSIDASNARAETTNRKLVVQWTVYRGHDAKAIQAFFGSSYHSQPKVAGPWSRAYFLYGTNGALYAYGGTEMLQVEVVQEVGAPTPDPATVHTATIAVAKVLFGNLLTK